jgi:hypothetical protein
MEALALVSLVSSVTFAKELISTTVDIRNSTSGTSDSILSINAVYTKLSGFSAHMKTISDTKILAEGEIAYALSAIKDLSAVCSNDCDNLLRITEKLRVKPEGKTTWKAFKATLRTAMMQNEISQMEERLNRSQATLTLHICAITRFAWPIFY